MRVSRGAPVALPRVPPADSWIPYPATHASAVGSWTDDSIVIANGEMSKGLEAIGGFFRALFEELPKDCAFDLTHCTVLSEHVYIMWTAESDSVIYDFATDTFAVQDGKITLQTIGFVKRTK